MLAFSIAAGAVFGFGLLAYLIQLFGRRFPRQVTAAVGLFVLAYLVVMAGAWISGVLTDSGAWRVDADDRECPGPPHGC